MSGGVDSAVAAARAVEVDADDVVPRLDGAGGGDGGIDAATHGCKNSHTGFL